MSEQNETVAQIITEMKNFASFNRSLDLYIRTYATRLLEALQREQEEDEEKVEMRECEGCHAGLGDLHVGRSTVPSRWLCHACVRSMNLALVAEEQGTLTHPIALAALRAGLPPDMFGFPVEVPPPRSRYLDYESYPGSPFSKLPRPPGFTRSNLEDL